MKISKIDKSILILGCIAAVVGLIISCFSSFYNAPKRQTKNYPLTTIVTGVNLKDNTIYVTDKSGFVWEFYGAEEWRINDFCSLIMNDNGTEEIFDDTIIEVRHGWRS